MEDKETCQWPQSLGHSSLVRVTAPKDLLMIYISPKYPLGLIFLNFSNYRWHQKQQAVAPYFLRHIDVAVRHHTNRLFLKTR